MWRLDQISRPVTKFRSSFLQLLSQTASGDPACYFEKYTVAKVNKNRPNSRCSLDKAANVLDKTYTLQNNNMVFYRNHLIVDLVG